LSSESPADRSRSSASRLRMRGRFAAPCSTASPRWTSRACRADSVVGLGEQAAPVRVAAEQCGDVAASRYDPEALGASVGHQRFDQLLRNPAPAHLGWHKSMVGDAQGAERAPGKFGRACHTRQLRPVSAMRGLVGAGDCDRIGHCGRLLLAPNPRPSHGVPMQFLSDNAASVHPQVWQALQRADAADTPYDTDAVSGRLDEAFSALFGRDVAVLWAATGTAANCLALATMVPP